MIPIVVSARNDLIFHRAQRWQPTIQDSLKTRNPGWSGSRGLIPSEVPSESSNGLRLHPRRRHNHQIVGPRRIRHPRLLRHHHVPREDVLH
jgi:hypothetical protein